MQITLSPARRDTPLTLSRTGDALTINGEVFDFTPLPDGATLPREAIASDWFAGPVERVDGTLHLTLVPWCAAPRSRPSAARASSLSVLRPRR